MEKENDVQLIHRILSGDDAAFDLLVKKYEKGVHALTWRKIGDFHYAEEITQDAFLQAYKRLSTLKNPQQFAGWLYVIANRLCIDWVRKQKPAMQSLENTPMEKIEEVSYRDYVSEQERIRSAERRHESVKKLLEKLPESERTVVTLYYLGEMTTKEISKFLGVSVKTIGSRLRRARERLKQKEDLFVQEFLGGVQLSASLRPNIMRQVADLKPTPPPPVRPLLPWAAFGTAAILMLLMLGASNRYLTRFQKPYSFEAASEPTIKIMDTDIVLDTDAKPALRNQIGQTARFGKSTTAGLQISQTVSTPNASKDSLKPAATQWMPDANLREAVREALNLEPDAALTQADMLQLTNFAQGRRRGISDISGLERATNLRVLSIHGNSIGDLTPLANLTKLRYLNLGGCRITDVSPLANLASLETLDLFANDITDITPLANLINLRELRILSNPILDYTPLLDLPKIEDMDWQNTCAVPKPAVPFRERIASRTFPSIFGAWSEIVNLSIPSEARLEGHVIAELAHYDLYFCCPMFGLSWAKTPKGWKLAGDVERAHQMHNELLSQNPSSLLLMPIGYFTERSDAYPLDFPGWLRDTQGRPRVNMEINFQDIPEGEIVDFCLDFTRPEVQDIVVQKAVATARSGIYDGIMLGHWNEVPRLDNHRTIEEEHLARDVILQRIRAEVGDDFLIMVSADWEEIPRWAPYVNGAFMALRLYRMREEGYAREDIRRIEDLLKWGESNYRDPQINGLEGWGIRTQPPDSPENLRWMRLFTTMSLIHTDGYALYNVGDSHSNYWYPFWDADLGQPVGEKSQLYQNSEGLFIREFTNGWTIYNRSGNEQKIRLPERASGVVSRITGVNHTLSDLDGEIYLK
ncbi:sigma-70 family RNA polymerase sigma factor [Candidatus Poribacteria bacterium]|nr:sigma-70 family RNA polymerase sigma factor [Candidatus Poribacteria bacterium]